MANGIRLTCDDKFITPKTIARQLGLSLATVYRMLESGEIPCIRLGHSYRIAQNAYEEWLSSQQQDGGGL